MYMYVGLAKIQSKGVHVPFNLLSWCIIYLSSSSGMHGTRREREREERDVQVRGYYFSRRIVAWTSFAFLCFIFMIWRGGGGEVGGAWAHKFSWPVVTVKSRAAACLASYRLVPWFSRGEHDCLAVFKGSARTNNLDDDNLSAMW